MVEIESLNNYLQNGDPVGWIYENHGPSTIYGSGLFNPTYSSPGFVDPTLKNHMKLKTYTESKIGRRITIIKRYQNLKIWDQSPTYSIQVLLINGDYLGCIGQTCKEAD